MDKNTITGFVLIGLILFGFTWYQSRQYDKQMAYQAQLDSIAAVERAAGMDAESIADSLQASAAEEGFREKRRYTRTPCSTSHPGVRKGSSPFPMTRSRWPSPRRERSLILPR